jgi:hypothetical protein
MSKLHCYQYGEKNKNKNNLGEKDTYQKSGVKLNTSADPSRQTDLPKNNRQSQTAKQLSWCTFGMNRRHQ